MEQRDLELVKISVHRKDRRKLKELAAKWDVTIPEAFGILPNLVFMLEPGVQILSKGKAIQITDAAISSEGWEDGA